jgi:hypothetical protein
MNGIGRRGLLVLALLAACDRRLKGNGSIAKEVRKPGPFSEIELRGSYRVRVVLQSADHSVTLEGDGNLLPVITSTTNGKRLVVESQEAISPSRPIALVIAAPDASLVRCSGANEVTVEKVENGRLQLDLKGAGSLRASGRTDKLKVFVEGAGDARLTELAARHALVMVEGAGTVDLPSLEHLEVEIRGAATVSYAGDPKVKKLVRGAGTLRKR